jgi:hypothetical protein
MKKKIAIMALSLALMSSTAMAETDAVSAVVRSPMGTVAGAVHRLFGRTERRRSVAHREQRVPMAESQPGSAPLAAQDQAAAQAAAVQPSSTAAASTMPPVQPLE